RGALDALRFARDLASRHVATVRSLLHAARTGEEHGMKYNLWLSGAGFLCFLIAMIIGGLCSRSGLRDYARLNWVIAGVNIVAAASTLGIGPQPGPPSPSATNRPSLPPSRSTSSRTKSVQVPKVRARPITSLSCS